VIEFSKTFLVFYKWPNLTDVQGIVHSTICLVVFVYCEHALWYFLSLLGFTSLHYIKFSSFFRFFVFCRARPGYPGGRSIEPKMRTEKNA
jgi:hypothetical protein